MSISGDVCQKLFHMFHQFLEVFGYDMPHVDLPMGKLQDCPVLADHGERFVRKKKKHGHGGSFKSEVMWIPRWMGFLSHIIEEMFTKFGCHQLEGGVGSLFCFRSNLQRFNEFNALQVARMSSICTFHLPPSAAYACKNNIQVLKWILGNILGVDDFLLNSYGIQYFLLHIW